MTLAEERFDRHRLIPGWQQDRLAASVVMVAGMGALGNEVTRLLAMAGVGRLIFCDHDLVTPSNLSRTCLFDTASPGQNKALAAVPALQRLAPQAVLDPRPGTLIQTMGLAELRDAHLVISCLDSREARLQLAGRCTLVGAPMLDGGTNAWGGEVRPFLLPEGPCYGCTLTVTQRAHPGGVRSCAEPQRHGLQGASAPVSALIGAQMALLAIRHLMGFPPPQTTLILDAVQGPARLLQQQRDPDCPLHQPLPQVRTIPLTHRSSLGALRERLGPGQQLMAWTPIRKGLYCRHCDCETPAWGPAEPGNCPQCGRSAWPRTVLCPQEAPPQLTLAQLGIPSREILAIDGPEGFSYLELAP